MNGKALQEGGAPEISEYFHYRDLKVFYRKKGSGQPVIFLHNGGNSHIIWDHQVDYFSRSHACYAFDLPGYGLSANPAATYPLSLYTSFLDEFVISKKLAPVILVGNCVGSATSLSYAMKKPENVDKLILFNILTRQTVWNGLLGVFFKLTAHAPGMRMRLRKWFGNWTVLQFMAGISIAVQFGNRGERDAEFVEALKKNYSLKGPMGALLDILIDIESFVPMDHFTIPESFPRILVIWGGKNRILPWKDGRKLCASLKPHRLEVIGGGGHVVMHELHEEVNAIMDEHIGKSLEPGKAGGI